jgi:hypothetical protein
MADDSTDIAAYQRTRLLRLGIVVLDADDPYVTVSAPSDVAAEAVVRAVLGQHGEVEIVGRLPRAHRPLRCTGHMEREPGRLQLRFVLRGDEHVDDIVVAEDEDGVVVFATVCGSAAGTRGDAWEGPWHVYLDQPLGDRVVIDGHRDQPVPYFNVYEEMGRERAAALTLLAEDAEPRELVGVVLEDGAEASEGAATLDRPLEPIGEGWIGDRGGEVGHVPPAVVRAGLDPQPALLVLEVAVLVDRIVVGRVRPDLAGAQVDPSAATHRIALEDRRERVEVDRDRPQRGVAASERVGELSVAVEPATTQALGAVAGERRGARDFLRDRGDQIASARGCGAPASR